jgi:hypothetical protein
MKNNIKKLLREGLMKFSNEKVLTEDSINFEIASMISEYAQMTEGQSDFPDAKATCLNPKKIVEWLNIELNRIETNKVSKPKDKKKRQKVRAGTTDIEDTIVTQQNIRDVKSDNIDTFIENFKNFISEKPDIIMDSNPKVIKADASTNQVTVNTGLPAIVGIIWDTEDNKFKSVSSCPGAGACVIGCYARKAFYAMDESKTIKLARRLNFLWNDPQGYTEAILKELRPTAEKVKSSSIGHKDKMKLVIRWNDAGDFFSERYVQVAKDVTKTLIKEGFKVMSYAYTKSGVFVIDLDKEKNFVINFSTDAHQSQIDMVNKEDPEQSKFRKVTRVPRDLWKEFLIPKGNSFKKSIKGIPLFRDEDSPNAIKDVIFKNYGLKDKITRESLKFTFELPPKVGRKPKFNVIVLPTGDNDMGAQRADVKNNYLLEH